MFMIFLTTFPEYSEKSGEFDINRDTKRLDESSGELECLFKLGIRVI
jgi:hypothetical protein